MNKLLKPAYITKVSLDRVIDGDTVEVSVVKKFIVRITDEDGTFDTPEMKGSERPQGIKAKERLKELLQGKEILMYIPTESSNDIGDLFAIGGRIVGLLFVDGESIADIMTKEGLNKRKPL